jgi:hypothetical protein
VEIKSTTASLEYLRANLLSSAAPTAPFDGWVQVIYFDNYRRFGSELTSVDSLVVFVNESQVASDPLMDRYTLVASDSSGCASQTWSDLYYNYSFVDSLWSVIQVEQGDVLDFRAVSDTTSLGTPIYTQVAPHLWSVSIQDPCATSVWKHRLDFGVVFARDTLELTIDDPRTVWPSIPTHDWHDQITEEVDNVLSPITVLAIDQGIPAESLQVKLEMSWVDTSGGHVHAEIGADLHPDPGDIGTLSLTTGTLLSSTDSTVVAETDENGEVEISFMAGEMGGEIEFVATSTIGGTPFEARDTVMIAVPGLTKLPDTLLTVYKKLGGTLNHPGPDDYWFGGDFQHQPDYNHWIRGDVLLRILTIVSEFDSLGGDLPWINDASLVNGGLFDISGHWLPAHNTHRVGRDIDFKITLTESGDGIYLAPAQTIDGFPAPFVTGLDVGNFDFEATVLRNCGVIYPEIEEVHFHLRFYPDSMDDCQ